MVVDSAILGSRNGTHVNGMRVTESVVKPGDLIQLGEYSLSLSAVEDTRGATPPPTGTTLSESVPLVDGPIGKINELKRIRHTAPCGDASGRR